jgi:tripartite-type tricarboxylate transporter receptor subunit TctC
MILPRRKFLHLAAGAAALPAFSRFAWALDYPTRPVRIVVGFAAGGLADIVARVLAQQLSKQLGQSFIVENRIGAGTNIATEAVVRATPDGYTLLHVTVSNAINATLYANLPFNFMRDIAPVARIGRANLVIMVNPSFPTKTLAEFIAYAKANPRKINFASAGAGSLSHVAPALFAIMTGVELVHVPYRGEALGVTDLLAGQVQVMFGSATSSMPYIRAGALRPLAVTTAVRWEGLPDVPAVAEFVPDYEASAWHGIGVPKDTPADIVDRLNREINAALADPKMKARLADVAYTSVPMTLADFEKFIACTRSFACPIPSSSPTPRSEPIFYFSRKASPPSTFGFGSIVYLKAKRPIQ